MNNSESSKILERIESLNGKLELTNDRIGLINDKIGLINDKLELYKDTNNEINNSIRAEIKAYQDSNKQQLNVSLGVLVTAAIAILVSVVLSQT